MKTFAYMLAVLACAVAGANCQVLIACPPNYCSTVLCAQVIQEECECGGGIYSANGGFCGCCSVCLRKIPRGGNCASLRLRGMPPTAACEEGTSCQSQTDCTTNETTWVCQSDESTRVNRRLIG